MKKLLFVALIGTFVACGEAAETTEPTETEVVAPEAPEAPEAPVTPDSTTAAADSTAPAAE